VGLKNRASEKYDDRIVVNTDRRYRAESKDSPWAENVENPLMSRNVATT
jgi:hypothetical protein